MRFLLRAALLCLLAGCGAKPRVPTGCVETPRGLDCEMGRVEVTCVPSPPYGLPCTLPSAEATEDAKDTETAIKAKLGVDAVVTSIRVESGLSPRTGVSVRLERRPATGDWRSISRLVHRIVIETFRSHVDAYRIDVAL